jgi:hypothetical protein
MYDQTDECNAGQSTIVNTAIRINGTRRDVIDDNTPHYNQVKLAQHNMIHNHGSFLLQFIPSSGIYVSLVAFIK